MTRPWVLSSKDWRVFRLPRLTLGEGVGNEGRNILLEEVPWLDGLHKRLAAGGHGTGGPVTWWAPSG